MSRKTRDKFVRILIERDEALAQLKVKDERIAELEFLLYHPSVNEGRETRFCEFCGASTRFRINNVPFGKHKLDCSYVAIQRLGMN